MEIDGNTPKVKRYISPITDDERMADSLLRSIKRLEKIGVDCSYASQADRAELEAERDRLRRLRGYGSKKRRSAISAQ